MNEISSELVHSELSDGNPKKDVLLPSEIQELILNELKYPLLMKGYLQNWKCLHWTKENWSNLLGETILSVRFGKRIKIGERLELPQWESTCLKGKMTYKELLEWDNSNQIHMSQCGKNISSDKYWAYFDYHEISQFKKINFENYLSWKDFGFSELKATDGTLWISTSGANTPCHIDTYGSNIVCQLYGKKRWTLFPEKQSSFLYPSRIPYEESSIYSKVGFPCPDMKLFPLTNFSTPFMITLQAGDVLLVPKRWWHFVESVDFAISINTWIKLPSDIHDVLKERIVMYQIGSLCQSVTSIDLLRDIFNPNNMRVATFTSEELINLLLSLDKNIYANNSNYAGNTPNVKSYSHEILKKFNIHPIQQSSFNDYFINLNINNIAYNTTKKNTDTLKGDQNFKNYFKILIESFTDERVIDVIKCVLEEKLSSSKDS